MKTVRGEFTTILRVKIAMTESLAVMVNANGIKHGDWPWMKLTKYGENVKSNGGKNTGVY